MCLVVRTFLSVILWGITLSFDWNLLLFMLPHSWIILSPSFLLLFYVFIIACKKYLSSYFLKKIKLSDK